MCGKIYDTDDSKKLRRRQHNVKTTKKAEKQSGGSFGRPFITGAAFLLAATLLMRIITVVLAEIYVGSDADTLMYRAILAVVYVLDDVIFACGAAMIAHFLVRGEKHLQRLAATFTLFILAVDFASSYIIALALDYLESSAFVLVNGAFFNGASLPGEIALFSNIVMLILNLALRALSFFVIAALSRFVLRGSCEISEPASVISFRHPICRMSAISAAVRIVPYLVYELYSTVYFLIRNISRLTFENVTGILLAYGEILIDGVITYFAVYIIMSIMSLAEKKKAPETPGS